MKNSTDLDTWYDLDAKPPTSLKGFRYTGHCIVVGESEYVDPVLMGFLHKSSGGEKAVATGGMGVQFKDDFGRGRRRKKIIIIIGLQVQEGPFIHRFESKCVLRANLPLSTASLLFLPSIAPHFSFFFFRTKNKK